MTEPTPLFDQTAAALTQTSQTSTPVDDTANSGAPTTVSDTATTDPGAPAALDLPAGPNLPDLQAFTDAIPDEGHRAIAQHLVDAFTDRDAQLQAFITAYTTATEQITALQAAVAAETARATTAEEALQAAITALQPAPATTPASTSPAAPTS